MTNQNVYQPHFLSSESRWVCGFGGSQSQDEVKTICAQRNGHKTPDVTIEIHYHDGEYLSGYTAYGDGVKLMESLGLARYVEGWGYYINDSVANALALNGKISYNQAVDYSRPARVATENKVKAAQNKRDAIFAQARETGQPVVLRSYSDDCDDPNEECSLDNVTEYAMPDGKIKTVRSHTW